MQRIAILLLLLCAGCTTDQPPAPQAALAPGQASIVVTRSGSLMYAGAPASIDVNGARVASLAIGQSYSGAVPPGPVSVTVSAWSAPGASSFRFNAEPGKSYRFAVTPRVENTIVGAFGGAIAQGAEGSGPFQVAPESL